MYGARTARTFDGVTYAPGARFRVTRPGARLSGMKPNLGGYTGWTRDLGVGDVIECDGYGPGWGSDPGYGVEWRVPGSSYVEVLPHAGSAWDYRPAPGYLQPAPSGTPTTGHDI